MRDALMERIYNNAIDVNGLKAKPEQYDLFRSISQVLLNGGVNISESPTGTGKTFAYLLSAALHAQLTQEQILVVVPMLGLQQQVLEEFNAKIKKVEQAQKIKIAILKGKSNYISPLKLTAVIDSIENGKEKLKDLLANIDQVHGDIDMVDTSLREKAKADFDIELEDVLIQNNEKLPAHLFYYLLAKEDAKDADIIVMNHHNFVLHMLCCLGGVDVPFRREHVIIDEAHQIDDSASMVLGNKIALSSIPRAIHTLISLIEHATKEGRKLLPNTKMDILRQSYDEIKDSVYALSKVADLRKALVLCKNADEYDILFNQTVSTINNIKEKLNDVSGAIRKLKEKDSLAVQIADIYILRGMVSDASDALNAEKEDIKKKNKENYYFLVGFSDTERAPSICKVVPDASNLLYKIFLQFRSVTALSGTMSDYNPRGAYHEEATFNRLKKNLGLNGVIKNKDISCFIHEKAYPARVTGITFVTYPYLPIFTGAGSKEENNQAIQDYYSSLLPEICEIIINSKRNTLILTASHVDTEFIALALTEYFSDRKIIAHLPWEMRLSKAQELFQQHKGGLLISSGADTGLDIKDNAISDLIYTRIPVVSPDNPAFIAKKMIDDERVAAYRATGKKTRNYAGFERDWKTFIRVKQGLGRIYRKEGDVGTIHFLDSRIHTAKLSTQYLMDKFSGYLPYFFATYSVETKTKKIVA